LQKARVIEVQSGDFRKSIETATYLWSKLSEMHADRDSILVNLGGGAISDLGGFVAATYKRGIAYMNIPTTLVGMVDAAIGGKTAINLGNLKNQVGVFTLPRAIFIYTGFLRTLEKKHMFSGIAEIMKYGLVTDVGLWNKMIKLDYRKIIDEPFRDSFWDDLIKRTVKKKSDIVEKDFRDNNERIILNFGHTFGHAFETISMNGNREELLHGHAVALGMICESYLSTLKTGLGQKDLDQIVSVITSNFNIYPFGREIHPAILDIMRKDKKSVNRQLAFTLIKRPGSAVINQFCSADIIEKALDFYGQLIK
jgi:3-dehydroquinate synthase